MPATGHAGFAPNCRCWAEPCAAPKDIEGVDVSKGIFDPSQEDNHRDFKRDPIYGKLYQDIDNPKIWHSKERSGDRAYGGAHWKKFKKHGDELLHVEDIDMNGNVMNKHKGPVGIRIDTKRLTGRKK
jgi:hypothetical protein